MKAQDILVVLKILSRQEINHLWTQRELGTELGISVGEINMCIKRNKQIGFLDASLKPVKSALREFLPYGFKYCFPIETSQPTRGIKTAYAASCLNAQFISEELPPVWPDPEGQDRGFGFTPLYPSVPFAVRSDLRLYQFLALLDVLRWGRKREVHHARKQLLEALGQKKELSDD